MLAPGTDRVGSTRRLPSALACLGALPLLAGYGCGSVTAPIRDRPVAKADIEVLRLPATVPDPESHVTVQTGGLVRLEAVGSHDPAGRRLTYAWSDVIDGIPSIDFVPNPIVTSEVEFNTFMFSLGAHMVTLTVRTSDGRQSSQTLRVMVTRCEECGGP